MPRPFDLVLNSAMLLVYYGYSLYWFKRDCSIKWQTDILAVYAKIEKAKYKEYKGLDVFLDSLREPEEFA